MCFRARIGAVGGSSLIKRPWAHPVDPTEKEGGGEVFVESDITYYMGDMRRYPEGGLWCEYG